MRKDSDGYYGQLVLIYDIEKTVSKEDNMPDFENAKRIGLSACIDKIGREFVTRHADTFTSGYGELDDGAYCFVGVSDKPLAQQYSEGIVLDRTPFPCRASCNVNYATGSIEFIECVLPACV